MSPYALAFVLMWLIPQRIGMFITVYFFACIQHPDGVEWEKTLFQTTVHIPTHLALRWALLSQTEHHIHHLMPSVPFYAYHRAFELSKDLLEDCDIPQRGLFSPAQDLRLPTVNTPVDAADLQRVRVRHVANVGQDIRALCFEVLNDRERLVPYEVGAHSDPPLCPPKTRQEGACLVLLYRSSLPIRFDKSLGLSAYLLSNYSRTAPR